MEELIKWCEDNQLNYQLVNEEDGILKIDNKLFILVLPKKLTNSEETTEEVIITPDFELNVQHEYDISIKNPDAKYFAFKFGGNFFYTSIEDYLKPKLDLLKYIGKAKDLDEELEDSFIHLGVRGKYEIQNGLNNYTDWCKKAKFFGHKVLGICEKHTLAGTVAFQTACDENDITPIIGETIKVKFKNNYIEVKLYCTNDQSWKDLLYIHKVVRIDNEELGYIDLEFLLEKTNNLVVILNPNFYYDNYLLTSFSKNSKAVFMQIDSVEWSNNKTDLSYLESLNLYLSNSKYQKLAKPVFLNDSFYLDKDYASLKKAINKIGGKNEPDSGNQHYKSFGETLDLLEPLFSAKPELFNTLLLQSIDNFKSILDLCKFKFKIGEFHLPKFVGTHLDLNLVESKTRVEFLIELIEDSMEKKGLQTDEYYERLEVELDVIIKGGFTDYFLILWDVIRWCKTQGILTGIGRGSAAGSLVAYLLDITRVDPLPYGLLFERFLNEGRIGKSLPDIDLDFEGRRRDDVKGYLEKIYGFDYVCSIGSYNLVKIKSGIKDLSRLKGINFQEVNYVTSYIKVPEGRDGDFEELFKFTSKSPNLKKFILNNPKVINDLGLILMSPKSAKVHPCATIIIPNEGKGNMFEQIPLKKDGDIYVSEWEGEHLEKLGYLKEDILGIAQLDKIKFCLELIEETTNQQIDIYNIPINDSNVMKMFQEGLNGDVFQFGSKGLTSFCKEVVPYNLDELVNMVALYRPGPISSGAHTSYIDIKFGKKQPHYDFMLESVTKETFGLYIFQEQVMKACQVLGGFDPVETDEIRKAMGKKKASLLDKYKKQFLAEAVKKGCPEEEADAIWTKLEVFSGYGFNKSHAVSYAMTGYISQWLKVHYPLQFWTTALQFAEEDEDLLRYLSEIKKSNKKISILPPDINISDLNFRVDYKRGRIYWNLNRIKQLGKNGIVALLFERDSRGKFFSLKDFLQRIQKKVRKDTIENLIISGAFDETCEITDIRDRKNILIDFYKIRAIPEKNQKEWLNSRVIENEWFWILRQKELSGFGILDYRDIFLKSQNMKNRSSEVILSIDMQSEDYSGKYASIGGIIKEFKVGLTKKKEKWATLTIDSNNEEVSVILWKGEVARFEDILSQSTDRIVLFNGMIKYDSYRSKNVFYLNQYTNLEIL